MRLVRTQNGGVSFRVYFLLALASLSLFFVGTVWAGVTGTISGVIRDSSGAVVPGVQVAAHNTETGLRWTTSTDGKGFYSFQALPVGTYDIEANKAGFKERVSGVSSEPIAGGWSLRTLRFTDCADWVPARSRG